MDQVQIQMQDISGNWRTFQITLNNSQMIVAQMRALASRYPDSRVRAVDMDNRLIDML